MSASSGRELKKWIASPLFGYIVSFLLVVLAQVARLPLHQPTLIPYITYVPFILLSAFLGGGGPGLLATGLTTLESLYFATEPTGFFAVKDPRNWIGLGSLAVTGVVASGLFEQLKRARRLDVLAEQARAELARQLAARQRKLESIIQYSPVAVALLRDPDFTFSVVNPAYQALAPGEPMVGRTVSEVWPAAADRVLPILQAVRDGQTAYHAEGFAVPLHRGPGSAVEERYFDLSYVPVSESASSDGGEVLVVAIEVTNYKRSEKALRDAHQELATIYASAPVALVLIDDQLRAQKVNGSAARFSSWSVTDAPRPRLCEVIGCLNALDDPQQCSHAPSCVHCPIRLAALDTLHNGAQHSDIEAWVPVSAGDAPDLRYVLVSTAPLEFTGKKSALVCTQDITRRKRAEDDLQRTLTDLQAALGEKTTLLKEVHHRVKNNLAVIAGLLSMKADATEIPEAKSALEESQQRVHSIALIHEHLYGTDRFDRVDFAEYAHQLVEQQNTAFGAVARRISICLDIEPIQMGVHRAVPCALILNELVANAFKHAFPTQQDGEIRISFRESAPGHLELRIEDNGIGLPDEASEHEKSLGLRIVRILTKQLEGSFQQEPSNGARLVLRFPAGSSRRVPD